jgi:predicted ATPase
MLLRVTSSESADPRTVATAVVGVLTELVREQPVLVAIDDVQWVDLASRRALEFAVRRLPAQLRLFVTRRSDSAAEVPLELDRALPPDAFQRVVLGSLSLASLHHIVRERLGTSPTRPMIARIAEASGGNPFFAIEILMPEEAVRWSGEQARVPQSVRSWRPNASKRFPARRQEAVLVATSLSRPTGVRS